MEIDPKLRSTIETLYCPTHNMHPFIVEKDNKSLRIDCCCPEFKVACFNVLKKLTEVERLNKSDKQT